MESTPAASPADTPAPHPKQQKLDTVNEEYYKVPAAAAPFMVDSSLPMDEDDPKTQNPNYFRREYDERLNPEVNHSGNKGELSFADETTEDPSSAAKTHLAGGCSAAMDTRDARIRQSLRQKITEGKPFTVCDVCKELKTNYTMLAWVWVVCVNAVKALYRDLN